VEEGEDEEEVVPIQSEHWDRFIFYYKIKGDYQFKYDKKDDDSDEEESEKTEDDEDEEDPSQEYMEKAKYGLFTKSVLLKIQSIEKQV
jgi:hypothetical protein